MTRIQDFCEYEQQVVTGYYRITVGQHSKWNDRFGGEQIRVDIGDSSGSASLLVKAKAQTLDLKAGQIVQAIILPRMLDYGQGGYLEYARPVTLEEIPNLPQTIPHNACPPAAVTSLDALTDLWECFDQPDLKRFLSCVFDQHYPSFLMAQGGWQYHHDFAGGLLVHSVSTAQECRRLAQRAFSGDPLRVQLITAAALLHDFGKALQIVKGVSNAVIKTIPHELLSLQMLHDEMLTLGRNWPDGGAYLAGALCWLARPASERKRGHDAELVHYADVMDVKADRVSRDINMLRPPAVSIDPMQEALTCAP